MTICWNCEKPIEKDKKVTCAECGRVFCKKCITSPLCMDCEDEEEAIDERYTI